jgi:hypothetical protein
MLLSGPVNILRLENKQGHVIYLFGDIHNDISSQYECPISSDSIRIDQLFKNIFTKNKSKKIGFYLETTKNFISIYDNYYDKTSTKPYIHLLRSLISDNLIFDIKTKKVIPSKNFPNVMFHYFDIRLDDHTFDYFMGTPDLNINNIIYNLEDLKLNYDKFINSIKTINPYFKKVLTKAYNKSNIKSIIHSLYKDIISVNTSMDKIKKKAKKFIKEFNEKKFSYKDYSLRKIVSKTIDLYTVKKLYFENMILMINDLYLLRRILDKNYNTDIDYIYAGSTHTINIAMFLLKYTDYKITHSSCNIDYLKKNVQNYNAKWFSSHESIILSNCFGFSINFEYPSPNQCLDITNFPKDFN